jgi:hypothetical protein
MKSALLDDDLPASVDAAVLVRDASRAEIEARADS